MAAPCFHADPQDKPAPANAPSQAVATSLDTRSADWLRNAAPHGVTTLAQQPDVVRLRLPVDPARQNQPITKGPSSRPSVAQQVALACLLEAGSCIANREAAERAALHLLGLARRARSARRFDVVLGAADRVLSLPVDRSLKALARYYQAHSPLGPRDLEERLRVIGGILPCVPRGKLAIVLNGAGVTLASQGDFAEAAKMFRESWRGAEEAGDLLGQTQAARNLAGLASMDGDHAGSLALLERFSQVEKWIAPCVPAEYLSYLNNVAFDLGNVGRLKEANETIRLVLANPISAGFPEWDQTRQQIAAMRPLIFRTLSIGLGSAEPMRALRDGHSESDLADLSPEPIALHPSDGTALCRAEPRPQAARPKVLTVPSVPLSGEVGRDPMPRRPLGPLKRGAHCVDVAARVRVSSVRQRPRSVAVPMARPGSRAPPSSPSRSLNIQVFRLSSVTGALVNAVCPCGPGAGPYRGSGREGTSLAPSHSAARGPPVAQSRGCSPASDHIARGCARLARPRAKARSPPSPSPRFLAQAALAAR